MKWMSLLFIVLFTAGITAQEKYSFSFAGNSIDVKIARRAPEGFAKSITINATTPITVSFMKNDKSSLTYSGKSIIIDYKKNDNSEDVADVTIDGTNWWSTRCIYFVTGYCSSNSFTMNGTRKELAATAFFDEQMGFPFSISKY